jgi:hypothetical protein
MDQYTNSSIDSFERLMIASVGWEAAKRARLVKPALLAVNLFEPP